MAPEEILLTVAEIAIAIIGFAGIVTALRGETSESAGSLHRLRLRIMVEGSASVMLLAFLPLLLSGLFEGSSVWAVASGVLAVSSPVYVYSVIVRQRRIFGGKTLEETLLFDSFLVFLAAVVEVILIFNTLGLFFEPKFEVYLLGVLLPLAAAVAMFVRAIFSATDE
jgi:hypothetical protein